MNIPIINHDNKIKAIFIGCAIFSILYFFSGRIQLYPPIQFDLSIVDKMVPYIPWSIWVYSAQFLFLFLALWTCNNSIKQTTLYYSMLLATSIAFILFLLIPIELPHQNINFHGINAYLWQALYLTDTPTNCFPSLHVALAILAAYTLRIKNKYWKLIAPIWALLICVSTLTTKQHYMIDILGGTVLALISFTIINYLIIPESAHENT